MKIEFRRITSSGSFIPKIDGLRFIAIASVVFFHLHGFILSKDTHRYDDSGTDWTFFHQLLNTGDIGVQLFFVISGFILGLPYARHFRQAKPLPPLRQYLIRRLTRLEPPYILVMVLLLLANLFITHGIPAASALRSFLASVTYTHNFWYGREVLPLLNVVAWSLEVEIQFYLLAPLLGYLFKAADPVRRRGGILAAIFLFAAISHTLTLPFYSILDFMVYFLIGFLVADQYAVQEPKQQAGQPAPLVSTLLALVFLAAIFYLTVLDHEGRYAPWAIDSLRLAAIYLFYHFVLIRNGMPLLSRNWVAYIGGMCYSIYLLHYPAISFFGNLLLPYRFSQQQWVNTGIYAILITGIILLISSCYYLMIERPCMDKQWPARLGAWLRKYTGKRNALPAET